MRLLDRYGHLRCAHGQAVLRYHGEALPLQYEHDHHFIQVLQQQRRATAAATAAATTTTTTTTTATNITFPTLTLGDGAQRRARGHDRWVGAVR